MSSNFIPLEEAAKRLGVTTEEIIEMRSRGDIFGYRDGASWKFKPEELERVMSEMAGDVLDEDPTGSSILVSVQEVGGSGSKVGSTIGSDLQLTTEGPDEDSDVALVPDPGVGSDVKLVVGDAVQPVSAKMASADDDDDELSLAIDDDELTLADDSAKPALPSVTVDKKADILAADSDLSLASASDLSLGSDVLTGSGIALGSDDNIIKGDSDPSIGSGVLNASASDLELADESDLVLGGGSDLALSNDSGINLMSPSDSGISLEDEPLDLAASGISGLELAVEASGSDVSGVSGISGVGSGVDVKKDEEFQLSPSGGEIETDEDSGSQVIELEDSSEFGDAAVALPADDGGFGDQGFGDASAEGGLAAGFGATGGPAVHYGTPEIPYTTLEVVGLLGILLLMCMSGILVTDVIRNMWAWSGTSDLTSGFTSMILNAFGSK